MKKNSKSSVKILLNIAKPEKARLSFAGFLIFISSLCSLGPFYIAFMIIEKIISGTYSYEGLSRLGILAAVFILGQLVFSGAAMTQSHIAAYNILFKMRVRLSGKLLKLPMGYFSNTSSGVLKKIIMGDVEAIEEFLAHNLVDLFSVIFIPVLVFFWLLTYNIPMALLSVAPVFLGVVLQRLRVKYDEDKFRYFFRLKGRMNSTIIDFIRGMPIIKAFNQSVFTFEKYRNEAEAYSSFWINMNKQASIYMVVYALLMDSGILFLLPVGGFMYLTEMISVSSFLMFMFIGIGLTRFMKQLMNFGSNINQISRGAEEIYRILETDEIPDSGKVSEIKNHDIEFNNVSFSYGKTPVLKDASIKMRQGAITAFVGPSGAGKTTAGRLIPRFWDVDSGEITLGGINIKDIKSEILMNNLSFVFQDLFMFNDTVLENIRMWNPDVSREKVIEISKQAQCHDFIMNLDNGYDTRLGAGGTFLSGGEKQRIAIARAIVKDSPVIILDEATSYADTENEAKIQAALSTLLKNKTVIIIAHRLSTIKNADQIVVFDNGSVIEKGTHESLLSENGKYRQMWDNHVDASDWSIGPVSSNREGVLV